MFTELPLYNYIYSYINLLTSAKGPALAKDHVLNKSESGSYQDDCIIVISARGLQALTIT